MKVNLFSLGALTASVLFATVGNPAGAANTCVIKGLGDFSGSFAVKAYDANSSTSYLTGALAIDEAIRALNAKIQSGSCEKPEALPVCQLAVTSASGRIKTNLIMSYGPTMPVVALLSSDHSSEREMATLRDQLLAQNGCTDDDGYSYFRWEHHHPKTFNKNPIALPTDAQPITVQLLNTLDGKPDFALRISSGAFLVKDPVSKQSKYYLSLRALFFAALTGDESSESYKDSILKKDLSTTGEDFVMIEVDNQPSSVKSTLKEVNERLKWAIEDYDWAFLGHSRMDKVTRALRPPAGEESLYKLELNFEQ